MNLIISFRSEMLKTRRAATFYLCIVAAALVPVIFLLNAIVEGAGPENKKDSFNIMMSQGFTFVAVVILPFFTMLACTMLAQIEFRNNTWKQVFASPQPLWNIFIARFMNVHWMVLLFLVLYNIFMMMAAVAVHFIAPVLDLLNQPINGSAWLMHNVNAYLGALAIISIQYWLGLRFRNFIVPLGIGFVMWWLGMMMALEFHTPNAHYFPYSFLAFSFFPKYKALVPTIQWVSVGYMILFLGLGYLDFRRGKR